MNKDEKALHKSIILFDGVCNLCNGFVRFVVARDPRKKFQFASLQSEAGIRLLKDVGHSAREDLSSIVLMDGQKTYFESTAALHVLKSLKGLWPLFYGFIAVPRPLRDVVYRVIAKNRYHWYGKLEVCLVPRNEDRDRFLK